MANTAVLVYAKCRISIHASVRWAYLTRGITSELGSTTPHLSSSHDIGTATTTGEFPQVGQSQIAEPGAQKNNSTGAYILRGPYGSKSDFK